MNHLSLKIIDTVDFFGYCKIRCFFDYNHFNVSIIGHELKY